MIRQSRHSSWTVSGWKHIQVYAIALRSMIDDAQMHPRPTIHDVQCTSGILNVHI